MLFARLIALTLPLLPIIAVALPSADTPWEAVVTSDASASTPRHEAGAVNVDGKIYLLGGRGNRPLEVFDPATRQWQNLGNLPMELHHFQPVAIGSKIYIVGAFTCCFPNEVSVSNVHVYDTATGDWSIAGSLPAARLRGSAAAVVRNGKIYLIGGNTSGHSGGAKPWFDEYDPVTNEWTTLPDAPNARDHFSAVILGNKLVAAAGRRTDANTNVFANPVTVTNIYNFSTGNWSTAASIPTARAGALTVGIETEIFVAGGEINTSSTALSVVEAFDVNAGTWRTLQPLSAGRHSGGGVIAGNAMHVVGGSLNTGGAPETSLHETLALDTQPDPDRDDDGLTNSDETDVHGTDPDDADSDDDGLADGVEIQLGTSPLLDDTDFDGLPDNEEIDKYGTDPLLADTDGDELTDQIEILQSLSDPLLIDTDADGLTDLVEFQDVMTNPQLVDTDDDGLSDFEEVMDHQTNPLIKDTDADGVEDGNEIQLGIDPLDEDSDGDTLLDGAEIASGTQPGNADSDSDGIDDATDSDPLDATLPAPIKKREGGAVSWLLWALGVISMSRWTRNSLKRNTK